MTAVGFGQTRDHASQRRRRQPFGNPTSEYAGAERSLPGDHQHRAPAFRSAAQDKVGESRPGPILIKSVKIDPGAEGFAFDGETAVAFRFDRLGRLLYRPLGRAGTRGSRRRGPFGPLERRLERYGWFRRGSATQGPHRRGDDGPKAIVGGVQGAPHVDYGSTGTNR